MGSGAWVLIQGARILPRTTARRADGVWEAVETSVPVGWEPFAVWESHVWLRQWRHADPGAEYHEVDDTLGFRWADDETPASSTGGDEPES